MEKYKLVLFHRYIDEEGNEEDIEEPYIVTLMVDTLQKSMEYNKTNVILEMCDKLIKFIEEGENDTDK